MNRHYLYDAHFKTPAVPAFLRKLKANGAKLCVATAAPREYVSNGLRRLGVLGCFDFVTDNRECAYKKEQPEYYAWLLERLGSAAERTWVFEDALYAVRTAVSLGHPVAAVCDASEPRQEELARTADWYCRDWTEFPMEIFAG